MNVTATKPEIFTVWSDEVIAGGRLDAKYWIPAIRELQKAIQNGKYKSQKLGDFITDIHYGVSTTNEYVDDGIRLLRILNLKDEGLDLSDVVYLPEEARAEIGRAFVHEGDMLISRSGSVGIVVVVPKEAEGFAFGSFMIRFTLNDKINKQYVAAWLNSEASRKLIEREKIGAIQGNITIETIKNFDIPIPPLSVQKEVVEKIQAAYEQKRKKEEEIKKILASIDDYVLGELGIEIPEGGAEQVYEIWSDEVVGGRLDPFFYKPEFKKLTEQLRKIKSVSFGEIIASITNGFDYRDFKEEGMTDYLRVGNIKPYEIDLTEVKKVSLKASEVSKSIQLQKGDLLLTRKGTFGIAVALEKDLDAIISSEIFLIRLNRKDIDVKYLEAFFNSSIGQKQFLNQKVGAIMGSLSQEAVKNILVPIPTKVKQEKIVKGVQSAYSKMRALRAQAAEILAEAQKQVEQMILA